MIQVVLSSAFILLGALIMFASVMRSKGLLDAAPLIQSARRGAVVRLLKFHRFLMSFFLLGYVFVAVAFLFDRHVVGQLFAGIIFLLGAAFVFMGTAIQSRMLLEIRSTFHLIVPLCSRCHKVRDAAADPGDRASWHDIESFVTDRIETAPAFCPDCMDSLYGLPKQSRGSDHD